MLSVHTVLINSGNNQKRIIYYYINLTRYSLYQVNINLYYYIHHFTIDNPILLSNEYPNISNGTPVTDTDNGDITLSYLLIFMGNNFC